MKTSVFTAAIATAGVLFCVASAQAQNNEAASLSEEVRGTSWHLVSLTITPHNGNPMHVYGPNPTGYTIFDRTGHFVTVTSTPAVPKFASDNILKGTAAEFRAASQGTVADFGTYKVDEKSHTLIMHVEGSSFPNWIGTDLRTAPAFTGNRMTWTYPSGAAKLPVVLIWERLR